MTILLYVLAYLVIGFGGVGALVWWRPGWFYTWQEEYRGRYGSYRPAHWEMNGPPWPVMAVFWPLSLVGVVVIGGCYVVCVGLMALSDVFTAKLDRLKAIDAEVGKLREERENLLKEAGL